MHTKYISVDGKNASVSSVNFSYTSLMKNREAGYLRPSYFILRLAPWFFTVTQWVFSPSFFHGCRCCMSSLIFFISTLGWKCVCMNLFSCLEFYHPVGWYCFLVRRMLISGDDSVLQYYSSVFEFDWNQGNDFKVSQTYSPSQMQIIRDPWVLELLTQVFTFPSFPLCTPFRSFFESCYVFPCRFNDIIFSYVFLDFFSLDSCILCCCFSSLSQYSHSSDNPSSFEIFLQGWISIDFNRL